MNNKNDVEREGCAGLAWIITVSLVAAAVAGWLLS
jgi:hypothetical protein